MRRPSDFASWRKRLSPVNKESLALRLKSRIRWPDNHLLDGHVARPARNKHDGIGDFARVEPVLSGFFVVGEVVSAMSRGVGRADGHDRRRDAVLLFLEIVKLVNMIRPALAAE
jgi:hypothetical protein